MKGEERDQCVELLSDGSRCDDVSLPGSYKDALRVACWRGGLDRSHTRTGMAHASCPVRGIPSCLSTLRNTSDSQATALAAASAFIDVRYVYPCYTSTPETGQLPTYCSAACRNRAAYRRRVGLPIADSDPTVTKAEAQE